mmetsp:Transcript_34106/g.56970  ORF Transcript_34106/g.56970 Transcript_34106/m.56970 type:complete len:267 (-) Transcript_34106:359-1159(-)
MSPCEWEQFIVDEADEGSSPFNVQDDNFCIRRKLRRPRSRLSLGIQRQMRTAPVARRNGSIETCARIDPPHSVNLALFEDRCRRLGDVNTEGLGAYCRLKKVIKALALCLGLLPRIPPNIQPVPTYQQPVALRVCLQGCLHLLLQLVFRGPVLNDRDEEVAVVGMAAHALHHLEMGDMELGGFPHHHGRQRGEHTVRVDDAPRPRPQAVDHVPQWGAGGALEAWGDRRSHDHLLHIQLEDVVTDHVLLLQPRGSGIHSGLRAIATQ